MNGRPLSLLAAVTLLAAGVAVAAQSDASLADLRACQAVPDAQVRLACYDAAMARLAGAPARPVAAAARTEPPSAAQGAPAPQAGAASGQVGDAGFGLPAAPPARAPDAIATRIAGRFDGWGPGTRLTLANGQVWEVTDATRASVELDSPAVRVRRGVLGSFFLEIDGVSATPRVRRVR